MIAHIKYLRYVLRHKWFVFIACKVIGVPFWQALVHDLSKLGQAEWRPYVETFYGPWHYNERPADVKQRFDAAWLHHQHANPHHWQYWVLHEDSGSVVALKMPDRYRREMLADWVGAGQAIAGRIEVLTWYRKNKNNMVLHDDTRSELERDMQYYFGDTDD